MNARVNAIEFPKTDELCSRLAFGTGRLFAGDLANLEATVRRAYDLGIRHFDSSVGYDSAAPHAALARLIRDVSSDNLFISTKIGHIETTFPHYKTIYRNPDALWGIVHECHRMLHGKIDLLQIHEADLRFWWDPRAPDDRHCFILPESTYDFANAPAYEVVRNAKSTGVCRYIGITGNSSRPLSRVADGLEIDSVMCAYNLDPILRGTLDHVAPVAGHRRLLLMAAGLLQSGAYAHPTRLPRHLTGSAPLTGAFQAYHLLQQESGLPAVELVCRWSLSVESVDKWVIGASRPEQIDEVMTALRNGPLPSDIRSALGRLALPNFDWADLWS